MVPEPPVVGAESTSYSVGVMVGVFDAVREMRDSAGLMANEDE